MLFRSAEQRAATAALIGALCAAPGFDPHSLVVQIAGSAVLVPGAPSVPAGPTPLGQLAAAAPTQVDTITIQAALDLPPRRVRALLRPYLGVIRVVFQNVRITVRRPSLTIEFDGVRDTSQAPASLEPLATPATPAGVRAHKAPRQVR